MQKPFSRRRFLGQTSSLLLGLGAVTPTLQAIAPFQRKGPPRFSLSLAAYSFREYFIHASHEREQAVPADQQIDLFRFLDYCAEQGCQGAELTSYYFPPDVSDDFLLQLRRHAFLRGVNISGTAVGNTFTYAEGPMRDKEIALVKTWIHRASVLGAPHIRVFAGNTPKGLSKDQAKANCLAALEECAAEAGRHGIFLGIENHGGIVAEAEDLLDIVQAVQSPWVGVNLDSGNFHTPDPYADLARCAPYAVNVQIKVQLQPRGKPQEDSDLPRLVEILRQARYQGFVVLEYEAAENPWTAVPRHLQTLKKLLA